MFLKINIFVCKFDYKDIHVNLLFLRHKKEKWNSDKKKEKKKRSGIE